MRRLNANRVRPIKKKSRWMAFKEWEMSFSLGGLSITFAFLLAIWEVYFFGFAGEHFGPLEGSLGWFTPDRLGFNMAWLAWAYLSFQLISIPFTLPASGSRFIGVTTAWPPWCRLRWCW
jgi:hypothetical protein